MEGCARSVLRKLVVWMAVQPPIMRLARGDRRMTCGVRMLRRVAVRPVVAATGAAAFLTRAQVNPCRADVDAVNYRLFRFGIRPRNGRALPDGIA
jgi:hypothetical protein